MILYRESAWWIHTEMIWCWAWAATRRCYVGGYPGGTGYEWMDQEHGLAIDHKGNVWIGGGAGGDSHLLKFTKDGAFLAQDDAFVADGYLNTRIAVMDTETGRIKRFWGAYGNTPDDSLFEKAQVTGDQSATGYDPAAPPAPQFRHAVHCAMVSKDDLVYVRDRQGDRIQVFTKEGKFLKEAFVAKATRDAGSVWDIAFSADPQQTYLYVGDGENELIHFAQGLPLAGRAVRPLPRGDLGKEPFDLIEPACAGRGEMQVVARVAHKPSRHLVSSGQFAAVRPALPPTENMWSSAERDYTALPQEVARDAWYANEAFFLVHCGANPRLVRSRRARSADAESG